nr:hypothetical protein [uncultured Blautia sp.]
MKKIIAVLMASIMACAMTTTTFAMNTNKDEYQAVLDKLNEEYSTDVHFASGNETALYSDSNRMDITPEEFEQYIREMIVENERANKEAETSAKILKTKEICEQGQGICGQFSGAAQRASSTVNRSKKVSGATVHLNATVTNSPGYWMYSSINEVYTTYLAGENTAPAFSASSYNYSLIDARRTCALHLYGYTIGNYGVIIDSNAQRYVEFWAGSGM